MSANSFCPKKHWISSEMLLKKIVNKGNHPQTKLLKTLISRLRVRNFNIFLKPDTVIRGLREAFFLSQVRVRTADIVSQYNPLATTEKKATKMANPPPTIPPLREKRKNVA
jgi:hypothetical protein